MIIMSVYKELLQNLLNIEAAVYTSEAPVQSTEISREYEISQRKPKDY